MIGNVKFTNPQTFGLPCLALVWTLILLASGCASSPRAKTSKLSAFLTNMDHRLTAESVLRMDQTYPGGTRRSTPGCSVVVPTIGQWIGTRPDAERVVVGQSFGHDQHRILLFAFLLEDTVRFSNATKFAEVSMNQARMSCENVISQRLAGFRPAVGGVSFGVSITDGSRPKYQERTTRQQTETNADNFITTCTAIFDADTEGGKAQIQFRTVKYVGRYMYHRASQEIVQVGYLIFSKEADTPASLEAIGEQFIADLRQEPKPGRPKAP